MVKLSSSKSTGYKFEFENFTNATKLTLSWNPCILKRPHEGDACTKVVATIVKIS